MPFCTFGKWSDFVWCFSTVLEHSKHFMQLIHVSFQQTFLYAFTDVGMILGLYRIVCLVMH